MKCVCLIILLVLQSCNIAGDSSNEIIRQVSNGEGEKAVLFFKYGGATVSNSVQVALLKDDEQLTENQAGNVFTCDASDSVKIQWTSNDTLEIKYDKSLRTFRKEQKINSIYIVYRAE